MTERRHPLRVAIVYHYVAHYREPVFSTLIRTGREAGIEYTIAAGTVPDVPSIKLVNPATFRATGQWKTLSNVWLTKTVLWQRGLLRWLWLERPDAVIFLGDAHFLSTWVAAFLCRILQIRVLMWTHGLLRHERGAKAVLRRAYYSLAHGLLLYGERARRLLASIGYPQSRTHVIYNSLDHTTQLAVRESLLSRSPAAIKREMIGTDSTTLVFSGRLERFKGLDLLLRAVAALRASIPDLTIVCIGDGPARAEFEALARELQIDGTIRFWGACYEESTLGKLFYMADLCVSPGPIGLLAIHSLTYGTPVLIADDLDTHRPEYEALSFGVTGATFRAGCVESLADAIRSTLKTLPKAHVMHECFRAVDARYTPAHQARLINDLVHSYCQAPRTPHPKDVS